MYYLFLETDETHTLDYYLERIQTIYVPGIVYYGINNNKLFGSYILIESDVFTDKKIFSEIKDILREIEYFKQFKILKNLTVNRLLV